MDTKSILKYLGCFVLGALLAYVYKPTYHIPNSKETVVRVIERPVSIPVPPVYYSEIRGVPVYMPSDTIYRNAGVECSSFAVDTILNGDTLSVIADCYIKALKDFRLNLKPVQAIVRDSFVYEKETVTYKPFFALNATVGRSLTGWDIGVNASFAFYNLALVPELSYDLGNNFNAKASLQFTLMEK